MTRHKNVPNIITGVRAGLVPLFVAAAILHLGPWPLVLYAVAASTDWLDGYLARKVYGTTAFGAFLDPLVDKTLILAAFALLWLLGTVPLWFVSLVFLRELCITLARMYIKAQPASNAGKIKATLQNILVVLILAGFGWAASWPAFALVALVTVLSGVEFFVPLPLLTRRRRRATR